LGDGQPGVRLDVEYASLEPLRTRIATHQAHSELPDDVHAVVVAQLPGALDYRLLDVGCGTGEFLRQLRADGHQGRLVGLDNSSQAVAAVQAIPGVDAILGSATELQFADHSFDVVTARHMLYHVDEPVRALREFRRVLGDGGHCVVLVNHAETAPRTMALVREVASGFDLKPPMSGFNSVHSDNLPEMMRTVFGPVRVERHDNTLIFSRPEPLIAFAVAVFSFCGIEPDSPVRESAIADVDRAVRRWFEQNTEPWRDPKGYTVCVAQR
jgi:SAM-dependent methyltransferase